MTKTNNNRGINMQTISISELVRFLDEPLAFEGMEGSQIFLLRENLQIPRRGGFTYAEKRRKQLEEYELPEGTLNLPVQYTNGEYTDTGSKTDATFISQGLVTVFHPEFYHGRVIRKDDGKPFRPLCDGYLDTLNHKDIEYHVSSFTDDDKDNPEFDRAYEFRNSLWIGGESENNAEGLVIEHLQQFARLYKIRNFLGETERELVEKSFSAYRL
jgi:hypothetical protein